LSEKTSFNLNEMLKEALEDLQIYVKAKLVLRIDFVEIEEVEGVE